MRKLLTWLVGLATLMSPVPALADPPAFATEATPIASNYDITVDIAETNNFPSAGGDEGAFRTICEISHYNYDDPIVFPGVPGASHGHQFFGNPTTDANSTYASLRNVAGTGNQFTCGGRGINKSAYWTPWVEEDNIECDATHAGTETCIVVPEYVVVYYKKDTRDTAYTPTNVFRFPVNFGVVTGFNPSNPNNNLSYSLPAGATKLGNGFLGWKCEAGVSGYYASLADASGNPTFDCPTNYLIGFNTTTPQCWNGTDVSPVGGRSHVAFKYRDNWGTRGTAPNGTNEWCPVEFPYEIPHFDLIVWYKNPGKDVYKNWRFSSDNMPGYPRFLNGQTGHSDFKPAWDEDVFRTFQKECMGIRIPSTGPSTPRNCSFTVFGDGRRGVTSHLNLSVPATRTFAPKPADPLAGVVDPVAGFKRGTVIRVKKVRRK